jgi:adenylate cyclase
MSLLSKGLSSQLSNPTTQASTRRLTILYIAALGAIALIAVIGQLLVQKILHQQSSDASLILNAEQQRSHSHLLSRAILELRIETNPVQRQKDLVEVQTILRDWKIYYKDWENQDRAAFPHGYRNRQAWAAYQRVDRSYKQMLALTENLISATQRRNLTAIQPGFLRSLVAQEGIFVKNMDQVIAFYQDQAIAKTRWLQFVEVSLLGLTLLVLLLEAILVFRPATQKIHQTLSALSEEKEKSERLLLNILPESIADRLKQEETNIADNFAQVTVLFADIVGFTQLSSTVSPRELVSLLNQLFSGFDELVDRYQLEKIKTIGDAYMVVGGLPIQRPDHAEAVADMALAMLKFLQVFNAQQGYNLSIRIGINTGPVVAGVIGTKKFIYDLWGDTVNVASRMESHGLPNQIHLTASTYECLRGKYDLAERGEVDLKGKGIVKSYFLLGTLAVPSPQTVPNSL